MTPFVSSLAFESPAQLGVDQAARVATPKDPANPLIEGVDPNEPWLQFLTKQKLSPRLQEFLTYAICLWDWAIPDSSDVNGSGSAQDTCAMLTTEEGLRC